MRRLLGLGLVAVLDADVRTWKFRERPAPDDAGTETVLVDDEDQLDLPLDV